MKKKPVDAIQGYRQFMHTHTYKTSEKFPIIWNQNLQSRDANSSRRSLVLPTKTRLLTNVDHLKTPSPDPDSSNDSHRGS